MIRAFNFAVTGVLAVLLSCAVVGLVTTATASDWTTATQGVASFLLSLSLCTVLVIVGPFRFEETYTHYTRASLVSIYGQLVAGMGVSLWMIAFSHKAGAVLSATVTLICFVIAALALTAGIIQAKQKQ